MIDKKIVFSTAHIEVSMLENTQTILGIPGQRQLKVGRDDKMENRASRIGLRTGTFKKHEENLENCVQCSFCTAFHELALSQIVKTSYYVCVFIPSHRREVSPFLRSIRLLNRGLDVVPSRKIRFTKKKFNHRFGELAGHFRICIKTAKFKYGRI